MPSDSQSTRGFRLATRYHGGGESLLSRFLRDIIYLRNGSMKILLAEDDPISLAVLSSHMSRLGYEVQTAEDGESALKMHQSGEFQIVVSDWSMPGLSGLDMCRSLRKVDSREYTYFIIVTALQSQDNLEEAMSAGVDDFLPKPIDLQVLSVRLKVAERILGFHKQIGMLQELLPICMYCKKIRNDKEFWVHVESYFKTHTGAAFTHSLCPDCYHEKIRPELDSLREDNRPHRPVTFPPT